MTSFAHQVAEFNEVVLGIAPRFQMPLGEAELKLTLHCLREEVDEFEEAAQGSDYVGMVDALIDLQYFALGALYKMGVTPDKVVKCCTAVHQANMTKKRGVKAGRGDGSAADAIKPEGWITPEERIGSILEE